MPLDANVAALLTFVANSGYPPMAQGTPEQARAGLHALMVGLRDPAQLAEVASVEDVTVGAGLRGRVYRPVAPAATAAPTVVYFHGGGFVIGDLDTHEGVCRRLARDTGAHVLSVDYRLAPEHPFPAAVDDAWSALTWAHDHVGDLGGDASRMAVGGDSAGGNLAAVSAQRARDEQLPLAAQLLVYPAVDLLGEYASRVDNAEGYLLTMADMRWFAGHYTGLSETDPHAADTARDPRLSPLLADDLTGLAPAVIATAEFDPLRDEGETYAAALTTAGVPTQQRRFDGLIHGFYGLEALSPAVEAATAWINGRLADVLAG